MIFFFFNDTATTEIYTLSLHDALPIWCRWSWWSKEIANPITYRVTCAASSTQHPPGGDLTSIINCRQDRKSTRLNSSHANISYAVFCLKKKYILDQLRSLTARSQHDTG